MRSRVTRTTDRRARPGERLLRSIVASRPRTLAVAAMAAGGLLGGMLWSSLRVGYRADHPREPGASSPSPAPSAATQAPHVRRVACPSSSAHLVGPEDRDFLPWVEWKYRYLLADTELAECARQELEGLLVARERLVREANAGAPRAELADIDRALGGLISGADRAQYEALRDSDVEQQRLDQFAGGIDNIAPLSDEQKRAILSAKLRRKQEFEAAMREAGVERAALSAEERTRVHAIIEQALDRYRDDFLVDASELLDDDQLRFLSDYETTEFELEQERLRIMIDSK